MTPGFVFRCIIHVGAPQSSTSPVLMGSVQRRVQWCVCGGVIWSDVPRTRRCSDVRGKGRPDMPICILKTHPKPRVRSCSGHSKPVPLCLVLSIGLSACARRWAQFRVGLVAWGMESRKESLAIKKFHPGRYNGQILKKSFFATLGKPNGVVTSSVWSVNLEPSTQQQSHKRPEVDI